MMVKTMTMNKMIVAGLVVLVVAVGVSAETIVVPAGGDAQAAVNAAQPGDVIVLQADATYGPLVLPAKSGASYITIQSSRAADLPGGTRVGPSQAALFARLRNSATDTAAPVIRTVPGAHHWRFIGVDIATATNAKVFDLFQIGSSVQTAAEVPHDIAIDRSWVHGFSTQEVQRGISLNGSEITISNSYISDIHGTGYDTQALCGWNGPGPIHIINNYLEAAGENVLFGGADPSITGLIPTGIEIRNNYLFKPLSWKVGHPTYAGIHWSIKNLLEIKLGRDVTIDNNQFENSWGDAQIGYAVLFTVRNQDGHAPWAVITNVSFANNVVKNTEQGFQLQGVDNLNPSQQSSGVVIVNNLFTGILNRFLTMTDYDNVTLNHNTTEQGGNIMSLFGEPSAGFKYTNNVTVRNPAGFGIFGDVVGEGTVALEKYAAGYVVQGNVIAGALARIYPPGNNYPVDLSGLSGMTGTDGLVPGYSAGGAGPLPTPTPSVTPTPQPSPVPTPVPSPSPSPTPVPSPSPTPTPAPTPITCTMTVNAPTLDQWSTGKLVVNLTGFPSPATLTATQTTGQVTVDWPTSRTITGTSVIAEFGLQSKKKSSAVTVAGPCGTQTINVTVR